MQIQFLNWKLSLQRVFETEHELATRYDKAAAGWDQSIDRMGTSTAYTHLFARLHDEEQLPTDQTELSVLDAGLGTGALTAALATHLPQATYTGVDISKEMLATASRHLHVAIQTDLGSISAMPYADNSFDYVISAHVVEHLPHPADGIHELMRVLKPGQPFVLVATRRCLASTLLSLRWNFSPLLPWRVRSWLQAAGAEDIAMQPLRMQPYLSYMSTVYTGRKQG